MRRSSPRRTRRKSRRGGGNNTRSRKIDCEAEGFSQNMRLAALGHGYKVSVGHIHADGEKWDFDRLKSLGYDGILEWYSRQVHTEANFPSLQTIPELGILVAFFNRYKIVAEKLGSVSRLLRRGVVDVMFSGGDAYRGVDSFKRFVEDKPRLHKDVRTNMLELSVYAEDLENQAAKDLPIEMAIDRCQCIMFYTVKHGKLPDGFVMDPRVEVRAKQPILINSHNDDLAGPNPIIKTTAMLGWLKFQEEAQHELSDPEVTFGVF